MARGILDRFFKQEVGGIDLQKEALENELYQIQMAAQQSGYGYSGGQPLPPPPMTVIPPAMEKEIMEKYLDVPIPENLDELKGSDRFWVLTSPVANQNGYTHITGTVKNGATAGYMQMMFASVTSGTVTANAGSYLNWNKMTSATVF
jgi:hypothetical protein